MAEVELSSNGVVESWNSLFAKRLALLHHSSTPFLKLILFPPARVRHRFVLPQAAVLPDAIPWARFAAHIC